ncbi:citrate synthase 3, mitochondrial [Monosporozyma unispora]|nr:hypothetical protein C6P44_000551 [Kazachstania unispora]
MQRFIHTTARINSSIVNSTLKDTLKDLVPKRRTEFLQLRKELANTHLPDNDLTVGSILGGMRGLQLMYWQSSTLDPNLGIKFHGYTIQDCQKLLPGPKNPNIFYPEAMFWLLLTGEIPNSKQVMGLTKQWNEIVISNSNLETSHLPAEVNKLMESLPSTMHPMTQFAIGVSSLSHFSKFRDHYSRGLNNKLTMWEDTFDDVMTLLAFLPSLAGKIYARLHGSSTRHKGNNKDTTSLGEFNSKADWAKNLTSMLGLLNKGNSKNNDEDIIDLIRLYTGLHVDHEGGNVSAHATHLVGSALSDPMLSYSSGLLGLAGPLHGLAAQDVVKFLLETQKQVKDSTDEKQLEDYLWSILNNHRVIPGYGHAVLRREDPRFTAMVQFTKERQSQFKDDPNVNLMLLLSKVAPRVLAEYGKCKNPHPNVDSASGILFHHYGLNHLDFITVIFGCSRAMGPLAQLVWDRIYGLPIERPKSVDFNYLKKFSTLS